jgi:type IV secretion system protein VirB3
MNNDYKIEIDNLALGLTRPPMIFGVSLQVAVWNMIFAALAYVYLHSFYVLIFFGFIHLIAVRLSIKEPRFLELYIRRFSKTPPVLNNSFWGGCNSYSIG